LTTLAKAKAETNETFIVQASLTIVTYDHQNMFIVKATFRISATYGIRTTSHREILYFNDDDEAGDRVFI
jgi:hypothetical protein